MSLFNHITVALVVGLIIVVGGLMFLAIKYSPSYGELCQQQFGKDYYYVKNGFSGDFCTNSNGSVRYLR